MVIASGGTMLKTFANIFRVPELRNKVLFTLFMLAIYRIGFHVPKGYIYFAMAFSVAVEMLNIRVRKRMQPLKLRKKLEEE